MGVSRDFEAGRIHAVSVVSLVVSRGEIVGIIGPSGSGKTTLLNLISGMDRPTTGRVFFCGREPDSVREWGRIRSQEVGFVFQAFHLLPTLSALENVQIPMFGIERADRVRVRRAAALLDEVGLANRRDQAVGNLSAGERQRVAIARSLANSPSVVLADEPTGNLDSASAGAVMDLLTGRVRERGIALVVVTHNPQVVARADRVVEIVDGTITRTTERSAP